MTIKKIYYCLAVSALAVCACGKTGPDKPEPPAGLDTRLTHPNASEAAQKEQWQKNGLVSFMWHWNVPASKEAWDKGVNEYDFSGYNFYCDKTPFDINRALTEGTWENEFILKDIEKAAVELSGGHKMVAISECGNIPDPEKCFADGESWSWFLTWDLENWKLNTQDYWKKLMASSRVLTRESMPSLK